jgi:iron(III) transport system substrate-binding protein
VLDGNSVVRDLVVRGELSFGLTDTDDACSAYLKGDPVVIIFPDQGKGELGTLVIPGSIALIRYAPHPQEGRLLLDYLVSEKVEKKLIESGWSHIPLHDADMETTCVSTGNLRAMEVNMPAVFQELERAKTDLTTLFIR